MVLLLGLRGDVVYRFDEVTESVAKEPYRAMARLPFRGFADEVMIGFRRRQRVFAGIYSDGENLRVAIPPQRFSWPGPYSASRRTVFSRWRRFEIRQESRLFLRLHYTFVDHEFPGPEVMDIFKMIAWKTSSAELIRDTVARWDTFWMEPAP